VRSIGTPPEGAGGGWKSSVVVEVAQNGWVETGDVERDVRFDQGRDVRGPVPVVVALERKVKDKDQRVVVTGGSSFLSNQFIGLLNNVDLGTNILNWLSEDENLITIQPRARVDSSLELSRPQLTLIVTLFLALLPVAFLVAGGLIWWRRRRA
jgi:hypothetical protein